MVPGRIIKDDHLPGSSTLKSSPWMAAASVLPARSDSDTRDSHDEKVDVLVVGCWLIARQLPTARRWQLIGPDNEAWYLLISFWCVAGTGPVNMIDKISSRFDLCSHRSPSECGRWGRRYSDGLANEPPAEGVPLSRRLHRINGKKTESQEQTTDGLRWVLRSE